jgi:hypothetical protein
VIKSRLRSAELKNSDHGGDEKRLRNKSVNLKGRDFLKNVDADGKIILCKNGS